jgi:predicted DNA-binding transcriptional regulator AlpA
MPMATNDDADSLLTLPEVARTCRISERHLARLLATDQGPPTVRVGRRRFVRAETLSTWLTELEKG